MRFNFQTFEFPLQRVSNARKKEADWYANCCDWIIARGMANRDSNTLEDKYNILNDIHEKPYRSWKTKIKLFFGIAK